MRLRALRCTRPSVETNSVMTTWRAVGSAMVRRSSRRAVSVTSSMGARAMMGRSRAFQKEDMVI